MKIVEYKVGCTYNIVYITQFVGLDIHLTINTIYIVLNGLYFLKLFCYTK